MGTTQEDLLDSHPPGNEDYIADFPEVDAGWRPHQTTADTDTQLLPQDLLLGAPEPGTSRIRWGVLYGQLDVRRSSAWIQRWQASLLVIDRQRFRRWL